MGFFVAGEGRRFYGQTTTSAVPNKSAMEALDPALIESYPTLGITVEELFEQEVIVDLGEDSLKYVDLNAEVLATN